MRQFDIGRQSEALLNKKLYNAIKNIETLNRDEEDNREDIIEGSLWIDKDKEELKYYEVGEWKKLFNNDFRLITEMLSEYSPKSPIKGQLWVNNGVLTYYNGAQWEPIKAIAMSDEDKEDNNSINASAFERFLNIFNMREEGNIITEDSNNVPTRKSQYLIPSMHTDKVFINGIENNSYEKISNVCFQYPTERIKNKDVSCIHVNPGQISEIQKKLILVDRNEQSPIIQIDKNNTEFYGMSNGSGKLLIMNKDYNSYGTNYIKLIQTDGIDFILAITYIFNKGTSEGKFEKIQTSLLENSEIKIDSQINNVEFLTLTEGVLQEEDTSTLYYDNIKKSIKLNGLKKNHRYTLFSLNKKDISEEKEIHVLNENNESIIELENFDNKYKYFAFIKEDKEYLLRSLKDINQEQNFKTCKYGKVKDKYKTLRLDNNNSKLKFCSEGNLSSRFITINENILSTDKIIVFINGRMLSDEEYSINNKIIEINKFIAESEYIILKDEINTMFFNKVINNILIPTRKADESIIYINGEVVCDTSTIQSQWLPKVAAENEIKLFVDNNGISEWNIFSNKKWNRLSNKRNKTISLIESKENIIKNIELLKEEIEVNLESDIDTLIKNEINLHVYVEEFRGLTKKNNSIEAIYIVEKNKNDFIKAPFIKVEDLIINEEIIKDKQLIKVNMKILMKEFIIPNVLILESIKKLECINVNNDGHTEHTYNQLDLDLIEEEIKLLIAEVNPNQKLSININNITTTSAHIEVNKKHEGYKEELGLIEHLENTTSSYIRDKESINIVKGFGEEQCVCYNYKLSSYIENPQFLIEITDKLSNNENGFKFSSKKVFDHSRNSTSLWIDGIRQYFIEEETDGKIIRIEQETKGIHNVHIDKRDKNFLLAIEPIEANESFSCIREILSSKDSEQGMYNVFKTKITLSQGHVRMFIDGIRQPASCFKILDDRTIFIKDIELSEGRQKDILIEFRKDLRIKEKTITINKPLINGIIYLEEHNIEDSILKNREDILIFINGLAYGNKYIIDHDTESIILMKEDVEKIGQDHIFVNEFNKQESYNKQYIEKEIKDYITFEWR